MSKISSQNNPESVAGLVEDSLSYGGLILIPGIIGGALLAEPLLRVYGPEFAAGQAVLAIMIIAGMFHSYQRQFLNAINAIDLPERAFRINSVVITSNLLMNIVLVWQFGWVGAAVATALAAAIGTVAAFRSLRRIVPFNLPIIILAKQWLAGLIMGSAVFWLYYVRDISTAVGDRTLSALMLVVVGAGIYFLVLLGISSEVRRVVVQNVPAPIER